MTRITSIGVLTQLDIGQILGGIGSLTGSQGLAPGGKIDPSQAFAGFADAMGMGFIGDIMGAAQGQNAAGSFSLGNVDFGGMLGKGLGLAATAALGPIGGIAAGFLGQALSGDSKAGKGGLGGAISDALGGLAGGIKGAIDSIGDAFGGKSTNGKGTSGKSEASKGAGQTADKADAGKSGGKNDGGGKSDAGGKGDSGGKGT